MVSMNQERERTRSEVADYLREFADELDPAGSRTADTRTDAGAGRTDRTATESGAGTPGTGTGDDSLTDDDSTLTADDDRAGDAGADATTDANAANRNAGDRVTIIVGNESATINPPETLDFAVDVDTDSSLLGTGADRSATFSLRWSEEHVEADDSLEVE
ncbi:MULTISPECIES: hypothetical protein [Saliphagus]|uniref:Amphi-Trp domain-containing protein n=1 Tax=Saliphagus infecundisoli TaxID=1849069 RepID=A0ABD5QFA5_9EURY|nr:MULTISPECIES: hypothetical protein [Saliphagus]